MVDSFCPALSADPAVVFASGAYDLFMSLAPQTFETALEAASNLTDILIQPVDFTASFDFDGELAAFQRPPRPSIDPNAFNFNVPAAPGDAPAFIPQTPVLSPAPTFNTPDPILQYGARPDTPSVDVPQTPADPADLVIPTAPDYVLPQLPTFIELNIPNAPTLQLPLFEGSRPDFVEPNLNENWSWTPEQYVSALFDKVRAKVSTMMDGGTGLEPIEEALFERGRSRLEIEVQRTVKTRMDEFSTRGFSEPNGIMALAIDEILQGGLNAKAALNQEVVIKSYEESLVNLRFAVQNGIALEQVATNLHIEEQRLSLTAAQFLRETSIAILNARVTVYNAKLQGYQTDATVFAARIQGELAKIEVFRAQIEGEKARGEINEQRVRLYGEQIRALVAMADFYRNQIEAVKAQAEVERSIIERFKAQIDAYSARWRAFGDEVGAYKAQIEAENSKAEVHKNLVQAFATRTQAWGTESDNKIALERLRLDEHGQSIVVFRAMLDKMLGLVQGEQARVGAQATRASALAQIYTADAAIEQAASAATDRSFQLGLEKENAEVNAALKAAEIRIQENIQLTQILVEVRKTLAQVLSQLAAASLSAMNFSAGVSSSRSEGKSCSTAFSWTGEVPDYDTL